MTASTSEQEGLRITAARRAFEAVLDGDELVVDRIPGVAHPINRGLDGLSVQLRQPSSGRHLFLKIVDAQTLIDAEFADIEGMAAHAEAVSVGPKLLASDETTGALLFEYLSDEWRFGTVKDFRRADIRTKAIYCIKALHRTDRLRSKRSVFDRIRRLARELEGLAKRSSSPRAIFPEYYKAMCDWIARIEDGFDAAGHELAACHVENSLSNFMIGPSGEIKLVDFDRSTNADPLFDIGALCNEYCRTENDIAEAAEIYCGCVDRSVIARVKLYMIGSAFHLGLWGVVSQFRAPSTSVEFFKYGQNQLLRCRAAIARWDVGLLMRHI